MSILENPEIISIVADVVEICADSIAQDHKIWFAGNGGSAADAQHLAAEFSGRFYHDRDPYFAEALHVNTSYLTAVANDYSYAEVYSRLIKAKGRPGDVLFGLSTSGNSENIIKAFQQATKQGVLTIGMTGKTGGKLIDHADICLCMPSTDTPQIQEAHMLIGHIICELVEKKLM
ncbi:UNVERIFIED_CONTAM: hypothetical protein GTU68_058527 [Idotea baltica]|nr:hypothetical protein [Idotea baltica]